MLRAGVAAFRASGAVTWVPFFLTLLAEAEGRAKEWDQGLVHLAEASAPNAGSERR